MGSGALPLILLLMSFIHAGLTQERPKAVVKVTPDERVFSGERVTLTCDIQGAGHIQWTYSWFKNGNTFYPHTTAAAEISFTAEWSSSGQYSCRGHTYNPQRSYTSSAVTLTVSDKLKPTLTVKPQSSVFTGDTVTLSCDVGQLTGWTIHWTKDSNPESTTDATKTIKSVRDSDEGEYRCRARRGNYYSEFSNTVKITVTVRPKPVVGVDPDRRVFRGETVTLTCDIQQTGVWQYSWYKDYKQDYSAGRDQNYKIPSVDPSHSGVYSCRGTQTQAATHTQMSDGVTLTVSDSPRSTLTVTPDSPVFTGETVTLTCVIESHSNWRYEWYKDTDSVMLQTSGRYTVNRDTLTIRGVNTSDQGQYWCRGQRDQRPNSSQDSNRIHLSVNASSSLPVTAVVVGSSIFLLIFISLLLLWRYKKNKDQQRNINQRSVPNQSAESQPENSRLQSDSDQVCDIVTEVKKRDDVEPSADVTYSEVTVKKNKKKMDKDDTRLGSNDVTYSEVRNKENKSKSKDINTAGPSDLVYAQIDLKDKMKTKGKGKSSESGDTLYSELKHNTDRGADAGDETCAQPLRKKNKTCL
ncbi:leukocyte immunoglobulin-like receptor subfamily B member 1 [Carassius gibelio]|uniref:leukocyte immunoglobulin-like receptor subfamily B member 1 n=1 Tax=Carassius gibelio TaxID=101364 RepID=UPI002277E635|nr:leukocyte immunoglobulin-like receptor subfamily B member 1 [Carassius gibelio]